MNLHRETRAEPRSEMRQWHTNKEKVLYLKWIKFPINPNMKLVYYLKDVCSEISSQDKMKIFSSGNCEYIIDFLPALQ